MRKISKAEGKRTYIHDENPERRVKCPNWKFSKEFIKALKIGAKKNEISASCFFEKIVHNFFILENPNLIAILKNKEQYSKREVRISMTLHPILVEDLKNFSEKSNLSTSVYIELMFAKYYSKYQHETKLKNLLKYI
ncbi:hypothetical protein [Aliarcobacter cibarius]|uniref:CopG family transcriptional regulator n=1 Tax=Aliarcobacter cibarius TaxID=255507 RepID=A0ABY2V4P3_9BACT|nr:hypothetical protein [Aliarcobacter cibarius]TLS99934.1 hypothetical protein FE247_05225 [Aliarcobacter cibarius]TLT00343.1 hypothetical protein FE245_05655 [Aliarcobacter cibarius]